MTTRKRIELLEQAVGDLPSPEPMGAAIWESLKDFGVPKARVEELWAENAIWGCRTPEMLCAFMGAVSREPSFTPARP